jgi:hypothetical protein
MSDTKPIKCASLTRLPTVSIIIPAYNRAGLLKQTLDSIALQTSAPMEVIVVDDGSTDDSAEVAASVGAQVLRQANSGPGVARNNGLAAARGDYVLFLDSDDLITPDFIKSRLTLAAQGHDLVYGPWLQVWLDGDNNCHHDGFVWQSDRYKGHELDGMLQGWILFVTNCLIRRQLLLDVGGYPTDLLVAEDLVLMFKLLTRRPVVGHAGSSLLLVRQHPQSQISASSETADRRETDLETFRARVDAMLRDDPSLGSPSARGKWTKDRNRTSTRRFSIRLQQKLKALLLGHRIEARYEPARLGAELEREIRSLGLRPLRRP